MFNPAPKEKPMTAGFMDGCVCDSYFRSGRCSGWCGVWLFLQFFVGGSDVAGDVEEGESVGLGHGVPLSEEDALDVGM